MFPFPFPEGVSLSGDSFFANTFEADGEPRAINHVKLIQDLRPDYPYGTAGTHYSRNFSQSGSDWFLANHLGGGFLPQIDYQFGPISTPRLGIGPQISRSIRDSSVGVLEFGANNLSSGVPTGVFNDWSMYNQVYNNITPITAVTHPAVTKPTYANVEAYINALAAIAEGHVETLLAYRPATIILVSALDHSLTPNIQNTPEYSNLTKRQRVTAAVDLLNTKLHNIAIEHGIIYLDLLDLIRQIYGVDGALRTETSIRGTTINLREATPYNDFTGGFVDDGIPDNPAGVHPHEATHLAVANAMMHTLNVCTGAQCVLITESEFATRAGFPAGVADTFLPDLDLDRIIHRYPSDSESEESTTGRGYWRRSYWRGSYWRSSYWRPAAAGPPPIPPVQIFPASAVVSPAGPGRVTVSPAGPVGMTIGRRVR